MIGSVGSGTAKTPRRQESGRVLRGWLLRPPYQEICAAGAFCPGDFGRPEAGERVTILAPWRLGGSIRRRRVTEGRPSKKPEGEGT